MGKTGLSSFRGDSGREGGHVCRWVGRVRTKVETTKTFMPGPRIKGVGTSVQGGRRTPVPDEVTGPVLRPSVGEVEGLFVTRPYPYSLDALPRPVSVPPSFAPF